MSKVWSGHLSFGLLSIPVSLTVAARGESISFNMLHKDCGCRVKQQLTCPDHGVLSRDAIVKGYEYEKDKYVVIAPEELKAVEPQSARVMEIVEFVPAADVDPVYFDSSYYIAPDQPGANAYALLKAAMEKTGRVAIAQVTMHNREYTLIIRPHGKGLTVHTMYYADEVRANDVNAPTVIKDAELKLACSLIDSLTADFHPENYSDTYQGKIESLIDSKIAGRPIPVTDHKKPAAVVDIMSALSASLKAKPPVAAKTAEKPKAVAQKARGRKAV